MKLICVSGTHAGMEFPISHEVVRLGRDRSWSQIVFDETDRLVSRRHCSVRLDSQSGGLVLEDCNSSHGTFLDSGERLKSNAPRVLMPNSRFYIGSRANTFQVQ
jgi:pSer/pThr/pTyr-binding forkhead associated (FHA) protein